MSLTESLAEKILRLRRTAETADSRITVLPSRKRKSSELANDNKAPVAQKQSWDTQADKEVHGLLKRYKETIDQCNKEIEKKKNDFSDFKQKMDDLRAAYLFGLQKVSALKDLQDAPDAILFGNFPKTN